MDLQRPSPGDIFSVLLALASACAFYCPPTMPPSTPLAPRWLVEHGLQLELCASLGRTCSLHREGPGHPAAPCFKERGSSTRVDKPGGSWLHNPRVHLSPGECCEGFAFTTVLSPPCLRGSRPGSFLAGVVGLETTPSDVNGKPREREDLAVTISRGELTVVMKVVGCTMGSALCL